MVTIRYHLYMVTIHQITFTLWPFIITFTWSLTIHQITFTWLLLIRLCLHIYYSSDHVFMHGYYSSDDPVYIVTIHHIQSDPNQFDLNFRSSLIPCRIGWSPLITGWLLHYFVNKRVKGSTKNTYCWNRLPYNQIPVLCSP